MLRWYAIQTKPQKERVALHHLRAQGFHGYMPVVKAEGDNPTRICQGLNKLHSHERDLNNRLLFVGYLLARIDMATQRCRSILSTYGVLRLVSAGDEPLAAPDKIVAGIRARENRDGVIELVRSAKFTSGMPVTVTEGPFTDFHGVFEEHLTDGERANILLKFLGAERRYTLPLAAIGPAQVSA